MFWRSYLLEIEGDEGSLFSARATALSGLEERVSRVEGATAYEAGAAALASVLPEPDAAQSTPVEEPLSLRQLRLALDGLGRMLAEQYPGKTVPEIAATRGELAAEELVAVARAFPKPKDGPSR